MDIKKSLKDVIALVVICSVFAAALAFTNMLTKDTIADKRYQQELEAYYSAMPDGAVFDQNSTIDITKYNNLPASVLEVKKENNGLGYAVKVEVKGYQAGMIVIVGVSPDGIVYGANCPQSNETNGVEKTYGNKFQNLDMDGVNGVDLVAGSTMTSSAYKSAVVDAINAATIVGGGRTEEQKFADAISEALPAGNGEFTKVVLLAAVEGIDSIYEAVNGEGYVCVIGTNSKGTFIGVDKDGNVVGNHTDEHKALAEAAIASVKANETVDIDLTPYQDNEIIKNLVHYVKKTGTGTYLVEIETTGQFDETTPIVLMVIIDANGCVVDIQTVSYGDNENPGNAQLADGTYNESFKGKDQAGAGAVDIVAKVTYTTTAYKNAVNNAFNVVALVKGGDDVDFRTEEEKFADAISEALPEANGEFTKVVLLAALEGVDSVYEAVNGEGYVCVIGTDSTGTFIGVDKSGVAVGEHTVEHKTLAEAAIASVKANVAEDVDLTPYQNISFIKNNVNSVQKTASGTYIIEIKTRGQYTADTPIVIMVVIDGNGKILDAQTVSHNETANVGGVQLADGKFNAGFIGKDQSGAGEVDLVAGVTFTTQAYKDAINNAFDLVKFFNGGDVDFRTEEEKYVDAISDALPAGEGAFTKYFRIDAVEGFDAIYVANNGAGYVFVIGTDYTGTFIGVDANGVAIGESEYNALAESVAAILSATKIESLDITEFKNSSDRNIKKAFRKIQSVEITSTGTYIITISCDGFGINGDDHCVPPPSGKSFIIKIAISADGEILDVVTVEEYETPSFGGVELQDGAYNSNFIGKDQTGVNNVDIVAGHTLTTQGFKTGVLTAFEAMAIIVNSTNEGGTN